jgi:hypothetical protein
MNSRFLVSQASLASKWPSAKKHILNRVNLKQFVISMAILVAAGLAAGPSSYAQDLNSKGILISNLSLPYSSSNFPQDQSMNPPSSSSVPYSDNDWHFAIAPYLWFPGVHGSVGTLGRDVSVHASPADLLSNFRFGLMGLVDTRYKRFVAPVDIMWTRLGDDHALPFPDLLVSSANLKASEFVLTPKIGYRLIDGRALKVDALAGFRYWHFGQNLSFSPSTLGLNFSASQNWVDPLVGGRIIAAVAPKTEVSIAGDYGGWGVGAQQDYQIVGLLGYRVKPKWTLQAGYRYLDVDYRSGGTLIYTITSGVLFGVSINLK